VIEGACWSFERPRPPFDHGGKIARPASGNIIPHPATSTCIRNVDLHRQHRPASGNIAPPGNASILTA
jgi:hypothetical protein